MKTFSLKKVKNELSKKGIFHTDNKLADIIHDISKEYVPKCKEAYDPTCGTSSLLIRFDKDVKKYGQELEEEFCELARENLGSNCDIRQGDTLLVDRFKGQKFEVIVANPPFSISYEPEQLENDERFKDFEVMPPKSKADYAFIFHCISKLKDDGVFVCLCFPGILYRTKREREIRKNLLEMNLIEKIISIPGKYFADTDIETNIIVFRKNRKTTDVIFEKLNGDKKTVTFDEIKNNDFNLSVTSYIETEIKKEKIDPVLLELECQEKTLRCLELSLQATKIASDFGHADMFEFINKCYNLIDKYYHI